MVMVRNDIAPLERGKASEVVAEAQYERWHHWPVNWTAVWVGSLAALAMVLVFGLVGLALGAHLLTPEHRVVDLKKIGIGALIFSVCGAFFSFVLGGWVAAKVAGILRSEPAILHGAIAWLLAIPLIMTLATLGAGNFLGGWYSGLSGSPSWGASQTTPFERPETLLPGATETERADYQARMAEYHQKVKQWNEDTPKVTRNSALGAITALLLGLIGSVVGGWMASGEPMSFTHYRTRKVVSHVSA